MNLLRRSLLFWATFIFSVPGFCLSIYEIQYSFEKNTDFPNYTAFLVRYGNGTGFMRVRYSNKSNTETYVIEMQFDEVEGRSKIKGLPNYTLQFKAKSPLYIIDPSGKKDPTNYNPDILWFKKRADDKNYAPWGVTSKSSDGTWDYGKINDVKVLNSEDLTRSYVKQFFLETESFYKNLFNKDNTTGNSEVNNNKNNDDGNKNTNSNNTQPTNAMIHFIVVANTEDTRIGSSVKKDVNNIYSEMKDVSVFLGIPLDYVLISGNDFGKKGLQTALDKLNPGVNDVVMFYYSGHGFRFSNQPNDPYPQFDLRQSRFDDISIATMNLTDVSNTIKGKNARLNIILSDCCNSDLGLLKPEGKSFALTTKSLLSWDKTYCTTLFLKSKGTVMATAAKEGQFAYGNEDVGGYFTSNIITAMEKYLSKFQGTAPTWKQIITEAQTTTVSLSLSNQCKQGQTCRQDPVYAVNTSF